MKITRRQLRRIIREQLDTAMNSITVFDIVASIKRIGKGTVFAAYVTPRRDDRFEINDRLFAVVENSKLRLFDAYTPRHPVITLDIFNQSSDSVAKKIVAIIKQISV